MGYIGQTLTGIYWMSMQRASTRALSFLKIIILARILTPTQFGVFSIATLVLSFLEIVTETGINVFLIQEKDDINEYINTAWVVSIFRGLIISVFLLILSDPIAFFFHVPESKNLLYAIGIVPLIRGFINPSIVKLQKNLKFKQEFYYRFLTFSFDALIAIVMGVILKDPIALIIGFVAGVILEVVLSFIIVSPYPKFTFNTIQLKEIISRGKWLTGAGIFQYLFRESDDIVIGRVLGSYQLGLYDNAYKIATLPISEVGDVVGKVTLPVFARIADDRKRLRVAFMKTTFGVSTAVIPFCIVLVLFPREIINVLLGANWLEAATALQVVSIYALTRAIVAPAFTALIARKKQQYVTISTLISFGAMVVFLIPLTYSYGIVGAGFSTIIGSTISLPFIIYFVWKELYSNLSSE